MYFFSWPKYYMFLFMRGSRNSFRWGGGGGGGGIKQLHVSTVKLFIFKAKNKPLVVYRFTVNVMSSITTLHT